MNNDLRPINTLPNFKRFCMTIGELPTSYLETMTYYEMLVWFTEYMKNTIIPTINNNGLAVEELQNKYIELKSFVDNYFDNLDVQEEINNKLDEMVEEGTLQEIIADYLNSKAFFGYDNISAMKNSTNLINGSYAETLGYYNKNDGGGAIYKIRNITNSDVVDNGNIIALQNNELVAELIKKEYIVPEVYGAFADGQSHLLSSLFSSLEDAQIVYPFATSLNEEIDGLAIQKAINNFDEVKLSAKTYKINTNINVKNNLRINGCGGNTQIYSTENDIFVFDDDTTVDIGFMYLRCGSNYNIITINGTSWKNNRIHDLIIGGCKHFITNAYYNNSAKNTYPVIYDCSVKNVWMYAVSGNYALYVKGLGHFNFTIEQLHNGIGSVYLGEGYFKFVDCNFGFKNGTTFIADKAATILIMERCNIEHDEVINTSGIFEMKCSKAYFHLCDFVIRLNTGLYFVKLSENASDIRFEQCRAIKYSQNQGILFDNNYTIGASRMSAIKFSGSTSLLSDLNWYSQLAGVYRSAVRYNYGNDLQYVYQASQLSQVQDRTIFMYSDKKLYYKYQDNEYYDMSGEPHTFT